MITFKPPQMAIKTVTPEQMKKRVARYKSLTYPPDRYPDSQLPGHVRKNYLIVGRGLVVDDGKDPLSAIPIDEGFQMSYVEAEPGNGPMLHNHDSNETFVAIRGRWRVITSSARSASVSENVWASLMSSRSLSAPRCSAEAMRTVADTELPV